MDISKQNEELLSRYPKTLKGLMQWERGNLLKFQEVVAFVSEQVEDIKVPEIEEDTVRSLLFINWTYTKRRFYDFFDEVGVVILPVSGGEGFYYSINGNNSEKYYKNRVDAEEAAFEEALVVAENILSVEEEPKTD